MDREQGQPDQVCLGFCCDGHTVVGPPARCMEAGRLFRRLNKSAGPKTEASGSTGPCSPDSGLTARPRKLESPVAPFPLAEPE